MTLFSDLWLSIAMQMDCRTCPWRGVQDVATIFNLKQIEVLPVDAEPLSKETRKDPEFSKVIQYIQKEWPSMQGDTFSTALS